MGVACRMSEQVRERAPPLRRSRSKLTCSCPHASSSSTHHSQYLSATNASGITDLESPCSLLANASARPRIAWKALNESRGPGGPLHHNELSLPVNLMILRFECLWLMILDARSPTPARKWMNERLDLKKGADQKARSSLDPPHARTREANAHLHLKQRVLTAD